MYKIKNKKNIYIYILNILTFFIYFLWNQTMEKKEFSVMNWMSLKREMSWKTNYANNLGQNRSNLFLFIVPILHLFHTKTK